ncbi:hypothetical protein GX51_07212 [Blastomyces parvus]|uniref:Uncharacterized protein n=1 Tax=Blastomyces parvus TaxID=2060905 RepID=A0A2B7WLK0_9EURO|nr:hypothetical protein GX51_07212 [Blastomyces parvus]
MSRKQRHNQLADFEETETSEPAGREPWAHSTEYRRMGCYPQNRHPAAQVETRPGQQNDERNRYHHAVEAARELNIRAQDQREAGPRGRESSLKQQHTSHSLDTEAPRAQYHLSSKMDNQPQPAHRYSSDTSGYNRRIGNAQLVYGSGYPVQADNDYNSLPAFANPPHQNLNHLGYGKIPEEPAHPAQPNTSLPARSEQHHYPMNQGGPLRPLSAALTPRLVPVEKDSELGPTWKTGPTDVSQTLHKTR